MTPEDRKAEAEARKAEADALTSRLAAEKAEAELKEWKGAAATQQRVAESLKLLEENEKAAVDAQRARVAALFPDLSKVEGGKTTLTTEKPVLNSVLTHRALERAANQLGLKMEGLLSARDRVLVTADPDLASSDAAYLEVRTGLEKLLVATAQLLEKKEVIKGKTGIRAANVLVEPVVGAIASALPGILSLLSATRSMSTYEASPDEVGAVMAVAGVIGSRSRVVTDDFRLVPEGEIKRSIETVYSRRAELLTLKLDVDFERSKANAERMAQEEIIKNINAQLKEARAAKKDVTSLEADLEEAEKRQKAAAEDEKAATAKVGVIDSVLTSIDTFTGALTTVPAGGKRSPLAVAALREQLHAGITPAVVKANHANDKPKGPERFSHVLLVKAATVSIGQLLNDRPFWMKDKLSTTGSVSLSYSLIAVPSSEVKSAGVVSGATSMSLILGDDIQSNGG